MKRDFFKSKKFVLIFLFEIIFGLLILGSIIPDNLTSKEFLKDPIGLMKIDYITMGLVIGLFVPFVLQYIEKLNIFGFQIERRLSEKIDKNFEEAQKRSSGIMYSHERSLFSITAAIVKHVSVNPRQGGRKSIEIGMKDFPESRIFAEIIYHVLNDNNSIEVNKPTIQESTLVSFFDLFLGKTDVYVEYSAIGFQLSGETPPKNQSVQDVRNELNRVFAETELCWLNPISKGCDSFNEWIMLKEVADKLKIETITDIAKYSNNYTFGAWPEYFHRASNQESFSRIEMVAEEKDKKLKFQELKEIRIIDRYNELLDKKIDVCVGWTRDSEITDPRIKRIKYDENFIGIPQHVIPICREDIAKDIEPILSNVEVSIEEIRELKLKAEKEGNQVHSIRDIAREFCHKKKWIK